MALNPLQKQKVIKVEALQDGNQVFQDGIENKDQPRNDDPRDRTERKGQGRDTKEDPRDRTEGKYQGRNEDLRNRRDSRYRTRQENQDRATIAVNLPEGAKLTFDDAATVSTGSDRLFITPPLERGKDFHYTLEAKLTRDGKTETTSEQITVRAGEQTRVDMRFAAEVRYGGLAVPPKEGDKDKASGIDGKTAK
jgi:uncharacterized protein (TIGR03000 family)